MPFENNVGSSPHTRGALSFEFDGIRWVRIIPAYAGSTRPPPSQKAGVRDHPRIRGEHCCRHSQSMSKDGSSPHTRGARPPHPTAPSSTRIIPAYAGSTWSSSSRMVVVRDHPRIRGEHASTHSSVCGSRGSSPHTRGARPPSITARVGVRIIPAYAGSTTWTSSGTASGADHPRIRGEHRRLLRRPGQPARIIPAYAGSTPA